MQRALRDMHRRSSPLLFLAHPGVVQASKSGTHQHCRTCLFPVDYVKGLISRRDYHHTEALEYKRCGIYVPVISIISAFVVFTFLVPFLGFCYSRRGGKEVKKKKGN